MIDFIKNYVPVRSSMKQNSDPIVGANRPPLQNTTIILYYTRRGN